LNLWKRWIPGLFALILLPSLGAASFAADKVPDGIQAKAALLVDVATGRILYQKDINTPYAPASTVKLLTALTVWETIGLNGEIKVVKADTQVEPSHIPLVVGETVAVKDLVYALLIGSDNDSAMALARASAGSVPQFVDLMNKKAKEIGMTRTNVVNPHGLPAKGEYMTAHDLMIAFDHVLAVPDLRKICSTRTFGLTTEVGYQTVKNHNKLLGVYPGMGPAKTGWTYSSRHTYAASATRSGREIRLVLLNTPNKWRDAQALFDYGFANLPPVETKPQEVRVVETKPAPAPQAAAVKPAAALAAPKLEAEAPRIGTHDPALVQVSAPAVQETVSYVVCKGDTMTSISRKFDVPVKELLARNDIDNPNVIRPGSVLRVPSKKQASPGSS
jgi:D-alanyl-D-alanine carboxypeptidase (penicillin-binding protein 5/6)